MTESAASTSPLVTVCPLPDNGDPEMTHVKRKTNDNPYQKLQFPVLEAFLVSLDAHNDQYCLPLSNP